jgi:MoaA/NifB/PqqE/SkfB family radical SAM enzyme
MEKDYISLKKLNNYPRLPLEGSIDLTYRCNNNCRHCWLRIPSNSKEIEKELSFEEIKSLVNAAIKLGCRKWAISGGEPMLRPDFTEIFDYITSDSIFYSLNTNGTLINSKIARLMKRKGSKMIALCGATAGVHDHITRNPGSFEATMRGLAYLKEAGAGFIVQLIPMRDNYHQFKDMVRLAESLSQYYRIGASWFYLSACGDPKINREILRQRLPPKVVVKLDKPDLFYDDYFKNQISDKNCCPQKDDYFFSSCISKRRDFHIDPYGQMGFCSFIKDSRLLYDLRKGNFRDFWEKFVPSLAYTFKYGKEYLKNCGSCKLKEDCRFCPAYAYLEHRRFSSKVEYLCKIAKENRKYKENWQKHHRRYYQIAGITLQVDSELPFNANTFHPDFKKFKVDKPGKDVIAIKHQFRLPDINGNDLGKEVYRKLPWAIYKKGRSWIYLGISHECDNNDLYCVAVFNHEHTRASIFHASKRAFLNGGLRSLTLFPSDQILLARVLANKESCFLHSCGVNFKGKGLLFVGHSGTGKSTIAKMLRGKAEILCDDRIIVCPKKEGFSIYGTWCHGEISDFSANSVDLNAILFLKKAKRNKIIPLDNKKKKTKSLLGTLIKPLVTVDWWEKTLPLLDKLLSEIRCYSLYFDKSGEVVQLLESFLKK